MRKFIYSITLSLILPVSGCSTIITGTEQKLAFDSEPDGAKIIIAGKVVGETPLSVQIDKGKGQSVTFEKDGYKPHITQLSTSFNSWGWANIINYGIGLIVDESSGAMYEFEPGQYSVILTPEIPFSMPIPEPGKIE